MNIFLVGPVAGSVELLQELTDASQKAKSILNQANLSLDVAFIGVDGPETISDPRLGDPYYEQLANIGRPLAVNIAVASNVRGLDGEEQDLSISVLEPQPGVPSARSVSVMSLREIVGNDGRFNFRGDGSSQIFEDEVKIAGEEIAQLIGHALGLQHIIELDGDRVVRSDNLGDTLTCITFVDCREERDIRENFMFPELIGIPGEGQKTYSREKITPEQAARMQQSPLVE